MLRKMFDTEKRACVAGTEVHRLTIAGGDVVRGQQRPIEIYSIKPGGAGDYHV
jgi:hypothetical protein